MNIARLFLITMIFVFGFISSASAGCYRSVVTKKIVCTNTNNTYKRFVPRQRVYTPQQRLYVPQQTYVNPCSSYDGSSIGAVIARNQGCQNPWAIQQAEESDKLMRDVTKKAIQMMGGG